jgi:hypothetical protein
VPAFTWRYWRKPQITSVITAGYGLKFEHWTVLLRIRRATYFIAMCCVFSIAMVTRIWSLSIEAVESEICRNKESRQALHWLVIHSYFKDSLMISSACSLMFCVLFGLRMDALGAAGRKQIHNLTSRGNSIDIASSNEEKPQWGVMYRQAAVTGQVIRVTLRDRKFLGVHKVQRNILEYTKV